jgi:bud emergence protein 1
MSSPTPIPKSQVFYAVVLHDFAAERPDELDAKSGDSITVVAQSNREWFVAKPIGKLGRPGLIPVSFVEVHDPTTGKPILDVNALMDRGDLPKVEDWKRAMFNYKQNSITLGVIDAPNHDSYSNSLYMTQTLPPPANDLSTVTQGPSPSQPNYHSTDLNVADTHETLPEGILLTADVISFHYEMEEYWFRIDAIFQPFSRFGQSKLPPAKQLILFRVYSDFYDFQVSLLDTFPREAGRQPPHARILPYMPGPAEEVDDTLTASRRAELDEYLHNLCELNQSGAKYILEHQVVREFLSLKPGDVENETAPRVQEIEALFGHGQSGPGGDARASEMRDALGRLRVHDDVDEKSNEVSEYEDEGYAPSPQRRAHDRDRHPYHRASDRQSNDSTLRVQAHAQNHQRTGSAASFHLTHSPHSSRSNSPLPHTEWDDSPQSLNQRSASIPSTSTLRTSQAISSRSRSQSSAAASNLNTPPISAANPQTAFVKIKIFDRLADDLIAIRVHPRVSHAELMDKVQSRLGGEVANLRYRDSVTNNFVGIDSDHDLRFWMDSTDKHVLYAD